MTHLMRSSTLEELGLGTVLDIFKNGCLPATTEELITRIFGDKDNRGAVVVSGASGIVGSGKAVQLSSRLYSYGVPIVALDFPNAPDGLSAHYAGLLNSFGKVRADAIMGNIFRLSYNGESLPKQLKAFNPKFVLEAIPEILEIKKKHYATFRAVFPGIEIRSVTSGFPSEQLGVGVAHPAFPHNINKIWEIVESKPSAITQLLWSLGMIPIQVSDNWSFVLDVLFCGLTSTVLKYCQTSNMPFWKVDKYVRKILGPNPMRAHDAIGTKGATFLTWSCLYHLEKQYGNLYKPAVTLEDRKANGQSLYPLNHLRPVVNWNLSADEEKELGIHILGPIFQMTSLLLHEKRALLSSMNAIGELCAQFRNGILAVVRKYGFEKATEIVEAYQKLYPDVKNSWHPEVFTKTDTAEWQQLYVNAEHDSQIGVITISRESYSNEVDTELNRAIDWLKKERIERIILTSDFHFSSQMVGAEVTDFYPALTDLAEGYRISFEWSKTARRLYNEFKVSVGFINGKHCLGGFNELMQHCHYLVAVENANLGMPEINLPVIPGMEGCHWLFRKTDPKYWSNLFELLLIGNSVKAKDAVNWLVDYAGPTNEALKVAWQLATGNSSIEQRIVANDGLKQLSVKLTEFAAKISPMDVAKNTMINSIIASSEASLADAIAIQAKYSADFMSSDPCRNGKFGATLIKTMKV